VLVRTHAFILPEPPETQPWAPAVPAGRATRIDPIESLRLAAISLKILGRVKERNRDFATVVANRKSPNSRWPLRSLAVLSENAHLCVGLADYAESSESVLRSFRGKSVSMDISRLRHDSFSLGNDSLHSDFG
jgi:hypothetical protein